MFDRAFGVKALENSFDVRLRNTRPVIFDFSEHASTGKARRHLDRASVGAERDRVVDQIPEHLAEAVAQSLYYGAGPRFSREAYLHAAWQIHAAVNVNDRVEQF